MTNKANWEKILDEQWKETDHYIIWGNWAKDAIRKILKEEKQKAIEEMLMEMEKIVNETRNCPHCGGLAAWKSLALTQIKNNHRE